MDSARWREIERLYHAALARSAGERAALLAKECAGDQDKPLKEHGNGRGNPEITRFKGLGEMMPKVLWEITLNPRTRRLLRVEIADQIVPDRVIHELMGKDALRTLSRHHGAGGRGAKAERLIQLERTD